MKLVFSFGEGKAEGDPTRRDLLGGWIRLLGRVGGPADPDFVDWLAIERVEGREYDVAIHRHWLDPTRPDRSAEAVPPPRPGDAFPVVVLSDGTSPG